MRPELNRALGFFGVVMALGIAGAVLVPRVFKAAGSPESDILVTLKRAERDGLHSPMAPPSPPLVSQKLQLDRITVELEPGGTHAQAVFTLDFTGTRGRTAVSALGLERVPLEFKDGTWRMREGSLAPTLVAAVKALVARETALAEGNVEKLRALVPVASSQRTLQEPALLEFLQMTGRNYEARAWYLRAERDGVVVSEEFHRAGELPARPVDETGHLRLQLVWENGRFLFASGLM